MGSKFSIFISFFVFLLLTASPLSGKEALFSKGKWTFEYQTGVMFSPVLVHEDLPSFNFWQTNIRLGRMLNSPFSRNGLFRGNLEGIIELTSASVIEGKGSFIFGIGPVIRYNFLRDGWKLVPYVQAGGGICYTDAYYYEAIGQGFNFTIQLGIGLKYILSKRWSLDLETRYNHLSNAGMDERNEGVNAIGATVGLTYYFP